MTINYKNKYLKYKQKYLELVGGGRDDLRQQVLTHSLSISPRSVTDIRCETDTTHTQALAIARLKDTIKTSNEQLLELLYKLDGDVDTIEKLFKFYGLINIDLCDISKDLLQDFLRDYDRLVSVYKITNDVQFTVNAISIYNDTVEKIPSITEEVIIKTLEFTKSENATVRFITQLHTRYIELYDTSCDFISNYNTLFTFYKKTYNIELSIKATNVFNKTKQEFDHDTVLKTLQDKIDEDSAIKALNGKSIEDQNKSWLEERITVPNDPRTSFGIMSNKK